MWENEILARENEVNSIDIQAQWKEKLKFIELKIDKWSWVRLTEFICKSKRQ